MFQGYYNLTSAVLTHQRRLNVISNNMVNVSTPGYRADTYTETTFDDELVYRIGNTDKDNPTPIGQMSAIVAGGGKITNYKPGTITETGGQFDFALTGTGFFAVDQGGETVYTRNGSFVLDEEGYLYLDGVGRVLGTQGPIYLGTDHITADSHGNIYKESLEGAESAEGMAAPGELLGTLRVVDFGNYETDLEKVTSGVMRVRGAGGQDVENPEIMYQILEDSNVDPIQEMTDMMSTQRALQSAAQILKMYDQLSAKIVQIGPT